MTACGSFFGTDGRARILYGVADDGAVDRARDVTRTFHGAREAADSATGTAASPQAAAKDLGRRRRRHNDERHG